MEQLPTSTYLNYHHLRYFWTVAKEGSLRGAAERLRVSQPSICTQVRLLEEALGEKLFKRRGRTSVLTDLGQLIYGYADEIFALGGEVLRAARQAPTSRQLRLQAGIVDSVPKLVAFDILRSVLDHQPPVQLSCHEGKMPDLLAQLNTHRLDVVLADEPASPSQGGRVFNHLLAASDVSFCAAPELARRLRGRFPRNLHGAPALLPTQNCNLRRDLEKWFRATGIEPRLVAEFDDGALAKIVGTEGCGFVVIPTVVLAEAIERYGFVSIGRTAGIRVQFFAITVERRLTHPAILAITKHRRAGVPASGAARGTSPARRSKTR
jgi:LysR family transcriptional activator of nhaA